MFNITNDYMEKQFVGKLSFWIRDFKLQFIHTQFSKDFYVRYIDSEPWKMTVIYKSE